MLLDLLEFIEMRHLFKGSVYILSVLSAVVFKRGWHLIEEIQYITLLCTELSGIADQCNKVYYWRLL